ncbi:Myosin 10A, isoform D [Kappamyces sp. JEL0829]|nr:Myosin 10A, isoform D [Kappamyces sp. JEL0829]
MSTESPTSSIAPGMEDVLKINKELYNVLLDPKVPRKEQSTLYKTDSAITEEEPYCFAMVLTDYTAKDPVELTLEEGDIVKIFTARSFSNRYFGILNGQKGLLPTSAVKILADGDADTPLPDPVFQEEDSQKELDDTTTPLGIKTWFNKYAWGSSSQETAKSPSQHIRIISGSSSSPNLSVPPAATPPKTTSVKKGPSQRAPGQRWLWSDFMGGPEEVAKLSLSKQEIKRQEVIYEIIATEADYIQDLETILELYIRPLQKSKLIRPKDMAIIFSNIEQVLPVNQELLRELEKKQTINPVIESLGDIVIRVSDYLKMYTMYCSNHPYAVMKLQNVRQTRAVARFLDQQAQHPDSRCMDLGSFLLKPIQRVCKYPLLLRDLLRATDANHPDCDNLTKALSKIETVVAAINEGARHAENVHKMIELQSKFLTKVSLVAPSRFLVKSGTVLMHNAQGVRKPREVYLFNDMIIIAKPEGDKYKLLNMAAFDVITIDLVEVSDSAGEFPIEIVHEGHGIMIMVFKSDSARETWHRAMQTAVTEWVTQKNRIDQANLASQKGLLDDVPRSPAGIRHTPQASYAESGSKSVDNLMLSSSRTPLLIPKQSDSVTVTIPSPTPNVSAIRQGLEAALKKPPNLDIVSPHRPAPSAPTSPAKGINITIAQSAKQDSTPTMPYAAAPKLPPKPSPSQASFPGTPPMQEIRSTLKTRVEELGAISATPSEMHLKSVSSSSSVMATKLARPPPPIPVKSAELSTGRSLSDSGLTQPTASLPKKLSNLPLPSFDEDPEPLKPITRQLEGALGITGMGQPAPSRSLIPKAATRINRPVKSAQIQTMAKSQKGSSTSYHYQILTTFISGDPVVISKRFEDFFELHMQLLGHFPESAGRSNSSSQIHLEAPMEERILPELPAQMMFVSETVAMGRIPVLQTYLDKLLGLPPKISRSPLVLK